MGSQGIILKESNTNKQTNNNSRQQVNRSISIYQNSYLAARRGGIKQKKSSWGSAMNNKKKLYWIGLLPLLIIISIAFMHFHRREDVKEILLASWLQPFVQASFASSFPCHAPQRIQHGDLHSLIIITKTIAFWIIWHYYRVCTLLISSNPVTFHDFFHDHKFRVFLTLFSSTDTNSSVQQNACHSRCLITSLYCTLSLLWHLQ